ncbi:hypothetical protein IWQ61_006579 [Dispira simplex]|nr:hypothetical protein IWQ61_006579 [Dispira simplex]
MAGGSKVSTGPKKKGQKYQNVTAYKHNRSSKKTLKILALPVSGLCQRCHDIIQWKKRYRKYKPLTVPRKCVHCEQKKIKDAYHILCQDCSTKLQVCAKCREGHDIVKSDEKTDAELHKENQDIEHVLSKMSERERRAFRRKLERGEVTTLPEIPTSDDDFDDSFSDSIASEPES